MTAPTVNGLPLLECVITRPRERGWTAQLDSEGTAELAGKVTIVLDGRTFVATVSRSKVEHGRVRSFAVGGAGGLSKDLDARAYASASLAVPIADVMRETGETLAGASPALTLTVATWQRVKGPASAALKQIAEKAGRVWRVLADGTVWIGVESWSETTAKPVELDTDWSDGTATFADGIDLDPGTTYQGHRIEQVVHTYRGKGTITEASTNSSSGMLDRVLDVVRRELDFVKIWRCQVVSQHADGTLELLPENERIRGRGIDLVRISPGLAGAQVKVPAGAFCYLAFEGGDPSKPFVLGWESETGMSLTTLGSVSAAQFAARADKVDSLLSDLKNWANTHIHPTGVGPSGVASTPWQVSGPASVACSKLKVE